MIMTPLPASSKAFHQTGTAEEALPLQGQADERKHTIDTVA